MKRLKPLFAYLWGPGRVVTGLVLLAAVFLIAWFVVWRAVRDHVNRRYAVTQEQVEVTPAPPWIMHTDVRAEVFCNGSLENPPLSLLDDKLCERIYRAFSLHPWVAKVKVAKNASGVRVELTYRQPVCVVEVPGDLLPVDIEGVLLRGSDLSPLQKQSYPCLAEIKTLPIGAVGQPWRDKRVVDGAEIAAALGPAWQQLRLYRIAALPPTSPMAIEEPCYELITRAGMHVFWGFAPSSKTPGELAAKEKVARLVQYLADHGTLEGREGPQQLDVRSLPTPLAKP